MRHRRLSAPIVLIACAAMGTTHADTALTTELVASGLQIPLYVTAPPGDTGRIFILEQVSGRVQILNLNTLTLNPDPFLTVTGISMTFEQGLLGLAFHPDYANNGYFFVNYTDTLGDTVIRRFRVSANPDIADPLSGLTILSIAQPFANHNGGWLGFGPDGYLYIAMGDGGGAGNPGNTAQTLVGTLLGKMLRIDVDGDDFPADPLRNYAIPPNNPFVGAAGEDEIWAYGLRNPWRCCFDRATGDLWIADVGEADIEEINFQSAHGGGGENYGWRCMEGTLCTGLGGCTCNDPSLTDPIHEYMHDDGRTIIGGYVYRGCAIPDLRGAYFFGDYNSTRIWSFRYTPQTGLADLRERTAELDPPGPQAITNITSFGEDAAGEMYIVERDGQIWRIIAATFVDGDLNCDGIISPGDIAAFVLALTDPPAYLSAYPGCDIHAADINGDGVVSSGDIAGFVALLTTACP